MKNEISREEFNTIIAKDKITRDEYEKIFAKDENGCYVNLIIPECGGFQEMNLIGKKVEDYTTEEISHSKTYRRVIHDKIIDDENINYSLITSKDILDKYIDNNKLEKLYLINPIFGGSPNNDNIVYAPKRIVIQKEKIDEKLSNFIKEGNKVKMSCDLNYNENCLVPSEIIINYTLNGEKDYKEVLKIWGNSFYSNASTLKNQKNNSNIKTLIQLSLFEIIALIIDIILFKKFLEEKNIGYLIVSIICLLVLIIIIDGIIKIVKKIK